MPYRSGIVTSTFPIIRKRLFQQREQYCLNDDYQKRQQKLTSFTIVDFFLASDQDSKAKALK